MNRVLVHLIDLLYWDNVMFQWLACLYTFLSIEYLRSYFLSNRGISETIETHSLFKIAKCLQVCKVAIT